MSLHQLSPISQRSIISIGFHRSFGLCRPCVPVVCQYATRPGFFGAVQFAILIDLIGDSALEIQSECFNDLQYVYDMCMIHIIFISIDVILI